MHFSVAPAHFRVRVTAYQSEIGTIAKDVNPQPAFRQEYFAKLAFNNNRSCAKMHMD